MNTLQTEKIFLVVYSSLAEDFCEVTLAAWIQADQKLFARESRKAGEWLVLGAFATSTEAQYHLRKLKENRRVGESEAGFS